MAGQPGWFDLDERYAALSAAGDPLERLAAVVDFELFRPELDAALERSDRAKGGRPPYDAVLMFKLLVLQTLYTLADDQTEYQLKDRLSFRRFVGLALHDPVPDAKTIWLFREQLTRAGAVEQLFRQVGCRSARCRPFRHGRPDRGCHGGRGPAAKAHRAREGDGQGRRRAGGLVEGARRSAKTTEVVAGSQARGTDGYRRPLDDQARAPAAAAPGRDPGTRHYRDRGAGVRLQEHVGIDRRHGFIRTFAVTDAARHDGQQLGQLLDPHNTARAVWAEVAYRSAAHASLLARRGLVPQFQRPKPRGQPMPQHLVRGNASRARVRVAIEHVFAAQKCRLGLVIRSIGLARAKTKLGLANLVTNLRRLVWFETRASPA